MLREVPSVRGAMLHLVLLYSLLAALYVLALQLAALIASLGPSGFGALLAMSGVGMAIGAIVIAQMDINSVDAASRPQVLARSRSRLCS